MIRKIVGLAVAAALAAGAATAQDRIFDGSNATPLIEYWKGKPVWQLQAHCAGVFGALSNHHAEAGNEAEASYAKRMGLQFLDGAAGQLMRDRKIDRKAAVAEAAKYVNGGRAVGEQAIAESEGDLQSTTPANYRRSECLDLQDSVA